MARVQVFENNVTGQIEALADGFESLIKTVEKMGVGEGPGKHDPKCEMCAEVKMAKKILADFKKNVLTQ